MSGDASPPADLLVATVEEAGYQVRYRSTEEAWQEALQWPADLIVVAGGDGTVARVADALVGRQLPLAILPFGTANNVAKALGITGDGSALELARSWHAAPLRRFDVWAASTPAGRSTFIESLGGGFLGHTVTSADALEPPTLILGNEIDRGRYLLRRAVEDAFEDRWEVELDGEDLTGRYIGVEALNIRSVGPNLPLAPDADAADGAIDLVLVGGAQRRRLEHRLRALARARAPGPLDLPIKRGRELRLRPPTGVAFHLDGAPWDPELEGSTEPADIHIGLAGHIQVLAPHGAELAP